MPVSAKRERSELFSGFATFLAFSCAVLNHSGTSFSGAAPCNDAPANCGTGTRNAYDEDGAGALEAAVDARACGTLGAASASDVAACIAAGAVDAPACAGAEVGDPGIEAGAAEAAGAAGAKAAACCSCSEAPCSAPSSTRSSGAFTYETPILSYDASSGMACISLVSS